jgi:hypothetical protein
MNIRDSSASRPYREQARPAATERFLRKVALRHARVERVPTEDLSLFQLKRRTRNLLVLLAMSLTREASAPAGQACALISPFEARSRQVEQEPVTATPMRSKLLRQAAQEQKFTSPMKIHSSPWKALRVVSIPFAGPPA